MNKTIHLKKAVSLFLNDWKAPVITDYQLGVFVYRMYFEKHFRGYSIKLSQSVPEFSDFRSLINQCLADGILNVNRDFSAKSVFNILGTIAPAAEEIACTINPFAYVSHLSAMDYHGFTDRNPTILYISAPSPAQWKLFAENYMKKDLGENLSDYHQSGFPNLRRITIKKINRKPVHCYSSSHLGAFKNVKDRPLRVATIGRTFLDMLREPNLCGGIEHVLDVFQQHADDYLNIIVEEIDRHGSPIDKVRAGYILEELCGLNHQKIAEWEHFIRRGGSRKIDPTDEYVPFHSEKWCISINTIKDRTK